MALTRIPDSFIQDLTRIVSVYRSSAQTISTSTDTRLAFDTAEVNLGSAFNTGTNLFTAPYSGYYLASGSVDYSSIATNSVGTRQIYFYKNETTKIRRSIRENEVDDTVLSNTQALVYLDSGDTLGVNVVQDSGGDYTVRNPSGTFNLGTRFSVQLIRLLPAYTTPPISEAMVTDNRTKHKFRVLRNSGQSLPNGTTTTVLWNSEVFDTDNAYNTGTGVWTAPYTGYYYLNTQINITRSGTSGTRVLWMRYNAASTNRLIGKSGDNNYTNSAGSFLKCSVVYFCTAGDTVDCQATQSNGGSENTLASNGGEHSFFEGIYLGKPS